MKLYVIAYANDNDAFVPELWANEGIAILEENMIASQLVHRDFEPIIANFGDIVNTRKPVEFEALRKQVGTDVTVQDASAVNVQVPLDQHVHVSFMIEDHEQSKSFMDLVETHLKGAMIAQARFLDRIVLGQYPQFLQYSYGYLNGLTNANGIDAILGTRNKMNVNKAFVMDRNMILTPDSETTLLSIDAFTSADKIGDDGTALSKAWLGSKYGFAMYMDQNMASPTTGNTAATGAINNAAGYPAGTVTAVVDGFSAAIGAGSWFSLDGYAYQVVSTVGGATPSSITFTPGLRKATLDDAVVVSYTPGAINLAAGYALKFSGPLIVDGFTVAPQVGQAVTFGTASPSTTAKYTIIKASTTSITLDRPLEAALLDDAPVNIAPPGRYNLAFHKNAIALVVRPLAAPKPGSGAFSAVVNMNGFSVRVTISYQGKSQGHLVTLDMLCGVKVLDPLLGAVMLG